MVRPLEQDHYHFNHNPESGTPWNALVKNKLCIFLIKFLPIVRGPDNLPEPGYLYSLVSACNYNRK